MEFSNICNVGFAMNPKKMRKSSSDPIHLTPISPSVNSNTNESKSEWKGTISLLLIQLLTRNILNLLFLSLLNIISMLYFYFIKLFIHIKQKFNFILNYIAYIAGGGLADILTEKIEDGVRFIPFDITLNDSDDMPVSDLIIIFFNHLLPFYLVAFTFYIYSLFFTH